ncbi:MAG: aminotransferase class V-fold PLP-dependent enzyme, partial [Akkermansiaceae bacterium]|nr:aminotransferase class V-fold PLP-dependent enzyme [Akkermansiaceae bacterium]
MAIDPYGIRDQFPILNRKVHGNSLVYLDSAATSQKPVAVLDASRRYYEEINSNIHRGTHHLAQAATSAHEDARKVVANHLHAASPEEIIFTAGATDGINLAASALGRSGRITRGDEILISALEHHSNIVPWQMLCERTGATLKIIPVNEDGTLDQEAFERLLAGQVRVLAVTHVSNAFGTVVPVAAMTAAAKAAGALVLIDGAQAAPHTSLDLQELGADFYVFSGHKVYAPTGIGVLFGRRAILDDLPPWRGGGEMIKKVAFEKTTYNELPFKFEAGTPHI